MNRWWCYWWQMVVVALVFMVFLPTPTISHPQTRILYTGCSLINATNVQNFFTNLNDTYSEVRRQLSTNNTYFATADQTRNSEPVYVMAQCRKYMSTRDCLACFDYSVRSIRPCGLGNGARVILDGCFIRACIQNQHEFVPFAFDTFGFLTPDAVTLLKRVQRVLRDQVTSARCLEYVFSRIGFAIQKGIAAQLVVRLSSIGLYGSSSFYDETTRPGNVGLCGNPTSSGQNVFETAVDGLLTNLSIATPKINGFYAAVTAPVSGTNTTTAYAIAQCVESITSDGCKTCLQQAYTNIISCATDVTNGRAFEAGCFMRYSASGFFANNQTVDITPFLQDGGSSKKGAIIGGVAGGVGFLIILLIVSLLWYRRSKKRTPRGSLYGATELQSPKDYSYNDIKKATKNFNENNKLAEGGFGDVYKGTVKDGNIVVVKKLAIGSNTAKDGNIVAVKKLAIGSKVVMLLSDRSRVQNPPSRQNVNLSDIRIQIDNSTSTILSTSNADATITELTGR